MVPFEEGEEEEEEEEEGKGGDVLGDRRPENRRIGNGEWGKRRKEKKRRQKGQSPRSSRKKRSGAFYITLVLPGSSVQI